MTDPKQIPDQIGAVLHGDQREAAPFVSFKCSDLYARVFFFAPRCLNLSHRCRSCEKMLRKIGI